MMNRADHFSYPRCKLTREDFTRFSQLVRELTGINLSPAKKTLLESRLMKRLRVLGMDRYDDYLDHLLAPEGMQQEIPHFIDVITTNKTDFFREAEHFRYLREQVVPDYLRQNDGGPLRIWSAGCSSGEEPYSIAIALMEEAAAQPPFSFSILASDISGRMLEHACNGIYDEERIAGLPPILRRKYFLRSKDRSRQLVRVAPEVREWVQFARINLVYDQFDFRPFHVIFCRNVMIYFNKETQANLLKRLETMLVPGGCLFLGHSETLNGVDLSVVPVAPTMYRKPGGKG